MPDATPDVLAELRRLAESATHGPWVAHEDDYEVMVIMDDKEDRRLGWYSQIAHGFAQGEDEGLTDAQYVAAASPDVVLGLLDAAAERDALAAKVERVRALAAGMGVPRPGAGTDRDSSIARMTLRSAGHRILRALDEEPQP